MNNDTASLTAYSPISATYNLTFNRAIQEAAQHEVFIRVDIITPKRRYINSKYHAYTMPDCLGSFQEMAISNATGVRNKYNPALWNVSTKYLKIPANDANATRDNASATLKMYKSFDRKLLKLDLDTAVAANTYEPFELAIDPKRIPWVVISLSDLATGTSTPVEMSFQRTIRYADQHGTAM